MASPRGAVDAGGVQAIDVTTHTPSVHAPSHARRAARPSLLRASDRATVLACSQTIPRAYRNRPRARPLALHAGPGRACASVLPVFGMGFGELVVLVIVAIVVVGPKDLPKMLRKLGQWSGKLRRMAGDLRAQSGIDDVLHAEGLGQDIAEIRKLARGELDSVSRSMRLDDEPAYAPATSHDADLTSGYVAEEREHPQVGPDGFDAMPDTSFVYGGSFPRSPLDRDPLYRTGAVDGVIPDDPPEPEDTSALDTDLAEASAPEAPSPSPGDVAAASPTADDPTTQHTPAADAPGTGAP